ncbi:hypothetical protein PAXRUDRAFT_27784 [Paxillus rubicundulus Ve08.2h10]|uniref:Uncharacterized protein n=1 Tax=Paxillus rubicundulus Ve08.2h10 TaxID=930991 RepID=A0A0D0DJG4_9AGAM|nr:hypothetical protein PAXRUDRAFT_27784 [Paxillus rubicundulus Ve08.2h10]
MRRPSDATLTSLETVQPRAAIPQGLTVANLGLPLAVNGSPLSQRVGLPPIHQLVTCEEIATEEDVMEIRGLQWKDSENDTLQTGILDLEEITDDSPNNPDPEVQPHTGNKMDYDINNESYGLDLDAEMNAGSETGDADADADDMDDERPCQSVSGTSWEARHPPSVEEAKKALADLQCVLKPR